MKAALKIEVGVMINALFYITNNIDLKFTEVWVKHVPTIDLRKSGCIFYRRLASQNLVSSKNLFVELEQFDSIKDCKSEDIDFSFLSNWESQFEEWSIWKIVDSVRWLSLDCNNDVLFNYKKRHTDHTSLKYIEKLTKGIIDLVETVQPHVVIFGGYDVGPVSALLLELICKSKGIPILCPQHARITPNTYLNNSVFNTWDTKLSIDHDAPSCIVEKSQLIISDLTSSKERIYDPNSQFTTIPPLSRRVRSIYQTIRGNWKKGLSEKGLNRANPIRTSFHENFLKFKKNKFFQKQFMSNELPEKFWYYPLHIEPELSTLLYSPHYKNQIEIATQVAKSLPVDYKLVIKDHPAWLGRRTKNFYDSILGKVNVVLVNPDFDSKILINKSAGVVTITGTAALEAAIAGKPVLMFGDTFFSSYFPNIKRVSDFNRLPSLLKELNNRVNNQSIDIESKRLTFLGNLLIKANLPVLGLTVRDYIKDHNHPAIISYSDALSARLNSINSYQNNY